MGWISRTLLKGRKSESCIDPNERVVFFPTVACRADGHTWRIPIHGWIYRPTEFSRLRRVGMHLVKRALRLKVKRSDPRMAYFRKRMGALLSDNGRGERIQIRLGENLHTLKKSRPNGHFQDALELSEREVERLASGGDTGDWLAFRAVTRSSDSRTFEGRALLLRSRGLSVVSDIDDTIKITEVTDRRRLLDNTFLSAFASVPDMAALYQDWRRSRHAAFHYVSASPWHLYPCLSEFLAAQGFPEGTFHMRTFRLAGRDLATAFRSARRVKSLHIKHLLECYPQRQFILVGDSGEADPEMYAHFAQQHPEQIQRIYIRNVSGEPISAPRWRKTFTHVPPEKWQLFKSPAELQGQ